MKILKKIGTIALVILAFLAIGLVGGAEMEDEMAMAGFSERR